MFQCWTLHVINGHTTEGNLKREQFNLVAKESFKSFFIQMKISDKNNKRLNNTKIWNTESVLTL
jgi:hypothetical protein